MTLPFQDARTLADSARTHALELGKALSIAVVGYGGSVAAKAGSPSRRTVPR